MQDTPYMSIKAACKATGLSMYFLRNGIIAGSVPHIKCGNRYFINVPKLLAKLEADNASMMINEQPEQRLEHSQEGLNDGS